jgi:PhnB protein
MQRATPYLIFHGQTEEAFAFYRSVFGGEITGVVRYRDMGMGGDDDREGHLVANIALPIARDTALMGSDVSAAGAARHTVGNNVQIHLQADDADEARRVFAALADGGTVTMPLEPSEWAELFGACVDRFGIVWMVDYTGEVVFGAP